MKIMTLHRLKMILDTASSLLYAVTDITDIIPV